MADKLVCVRAGSTLLENGRTYTVHDRDAATGFIELAELRGFLFTDCRFALSPTSDQPGDEDGRS